MADENELDDEEYIVEVILAARATQDGDWEYLIKWYGFDQQDSSWEPSANIEGCKRLLASFWDQFPGNPDFPIGKAIPASQTWIKKEREYFAQENAAGTLPNPHPSPQKRITTQSKSDIPQSGPSSSRASEERKSDNSKPKEKERSRFSLNKEISALAFDNPGKSNELVTLGRKRQTRSRRTYATIPISGEEDSDTTTDTSSATSSSSDEQPLKRRRRSSAASSRKTSATPKSHQAPKKHKKHSVRRVSTSSSDLSPEPPANETNAPNVASPSSLFSKSPSPPLADALKKTQALNDNPPPPDSPASISADVPPSPVISPVNEDPPVPVASSSAATTKDIQRPGMSSKPSAYVRTSSSQNKPQLKPTARSETSAATLSARLKMSNLEDNMIALGRKSSIDPKRIDTSLGKRKRSDASTASPTVPVAGSSRLAPSARPLQVSSDNNKGTPLEIAKASQSEPLMRPQTRNEDLPIASSPSNTSTLVPHQTLQTNESISMDISPSPPRMANIDLPEPPSVVSPQAENRPPSDIPSVHKFLASIIPEEGSRAMKDQLNNPVTSPNEPNWIWNGTLSFGSGNPCNIQMTGTSVPQSTQRQRLETVMKIYNGRHIELSTCVPVQWNVDILAVYPCLQTAKILARGPSDRDSFGTLVRWMETHNLISLLPLTTAPPNPMVISHLLVFPGGMKHLRERLKLPGGNSTETSLVAALVAQVEPEIHRPRRSAVSPYGTEPGGDLPELTDRILGSEEALARFLGFPNSLLSNITSSSTYNIATIAQEAKPMGEGPILSAHTRAIHALMALRKVPIRDMYTEHPSVLFINCGAKLRRIPGLADRRYKHPEQRFFTYGRSSSIAPDRQGVREIWPHGGLVTFVPGVLIENPLGFRDLLHTIAENPIYDAYLCPAVLGYIIIHLKDEVNTKESLNLLSLIQEIVLENLEEGRLSLASCPPERWQSVSKAEWIERTQANRLRIIQGVDYSRDEANRERAQQLFQDCTDEALDSDLQDEASVTSYIAKDLGRLQMQPAIQDNYRRFIMMMKDGMRTKTEDDLQSRDGIERLNLATFRFSRR